MLNYVSNVKQAGSQTSTPIYSKGYLEMTMSDITGTAIEINAEKFKVPTLISLTEDDLITVESLSALPYEIVIDAAAGASVTINATCPKVGSISADDNDKRRLFSFLNGTLAVGVFEVESTD